MKLLKANRLVVVNEKGRLLDISNIILFEESQDNNKTLKLFIERRLLKK